jgi:ketosteroid isomerase-like protein
VGHQRSTRSVLQHHLCAFDSGDMDAILSDYARDAVLITAEGTYRGHCRTRPVLQKLLTEVFAACTEFRMLRQTVAGEVAYIVWTAESPQCRVTLGTDTYVIRAGRIVAQTFAAAIQDR